MLNNFIVEGRLTKDPELKKTPNGLSICNIMIACDRAVKREGKPPLYIPATFFGAKAETVAKYFDKGKAIIVTGRLEGDLIEDKEHPGEKKTIFYIDAQTFEFPLGGGPKKEDGQSPSEPVKDELAQPVGSDPLDLVSDDLPF